MFSKRAYLLSIKDDVFHRFIERKKEIYDEGVEDITAILLMDAALVKYNQISQSGKWLAKTQAEEQLVALSAQLEQAHTKITNLTCPPTTDDAKIPNERRRKKKNQELPVWRYQNTNNQTKMTKNGKSWT
jgi:hypothetical protein